MARAARRTNLLHCAPTVPKYSHCTVPYNCLPYTGSMNQPVTPQRTKKIKRPGPARPGPPQRSYSFPFPCRPAERRAASCERSSFQTPREANPAFTHSRSPHFTLSGRDHQTAPRRRAQARSRNGPRGTKRRGKRVIWPLDYSWGRAGARKEPAVSDRSGSGARPRTPVFTLAAERKQRHPSFIRHAVSLGTMATTFAVLHCLSLLFSVPL